ncbi:DUF6192 family protein [Streptomyces canus]|nr:DUF6192 family protein [Streptomyces canus]MCX4853925.1 DUF6192 family protein [Streptomyces canus]
MTFRVTSGSAGRAGQTPAHERHPPPNPRSGEPRCTHNSAQRVVGWKVDSPECVQEKV